MDQGYLEHIVHEGIVIWGRPKLIAPLARFANQDRAITGKHSETGKQAEAET